MTFHRVGKTFPVMRFALASLLGLVFFALAGCEQSPRGGMEGTTPDEVQALVHKACILLETEGAAALDTISNDPQFKDKDGELYVFVTDADGIFVAHGFDKDRLGRDIRQISDIDGRPYGKAIHQDATYDGIWIPYKRTNPLTGEEQWKFSFVQRSNSGYVIGAGIYLGF